jgi:hypothetical protein
MKGWLTETSPRHQQRAAPARLGCDQEVIGADRRVRALKLCTNITSLFTVFRFVRVWQHSLAAGRNFGRIGGLGRRNGISRSAQAGSYLSGLSPGEGVGCAGRSTGTSG